MIVIGLTGGVASGKSLVAEHLQRLGAAVLNGDREGHEVLREPEVVRQVQQHFGDTVVRPDGSIDRSAVAKRVFAQSDQGRRDLAFLEQLTHPRIGERLSRRLEELRQQDAPVAVVDAALMFKAGWDRHCDRILFIDVPRQIRLDRALRRGWSEQDFANREAAQTPVEEKRSRSDTTIDNSGALEQTRRQVEEFWQSLDLG
jgi:dephospho-CoA kinase